MHTLKTIVAGTALLFLLPCSASLAQHGEHQHADQHGEVDFTTSCTPAAQSSFETGLALLHHMMYDQAEARFAAAAEADPECAMAQWGIAMSVIHPLWGERPSDAALAKGRAAIEKGKAAQRATAREKAYVEAVEAFYTDYENTPYAAQLEAFEAAHRTLHQAHPDDIDAAAFYALGQLATAPKADKTFARNREAGALLQRLHARAPMHPGLFHYIIHAYDNPVLASEALDVARAYDKVAPSVPHALHMPSHIFVRLGLWPDVISWNLRSADAALNQPVGGKTSMHYAHALDYLAYAYLQQGQDEKAKEVIDLMSEAARNIQPSFAAAYAVAAVPARHALERGAWEQAMNLPVRAQTSFSWEAFPGAEAITYYARGLGAARTGDEDGAREAIASLDRIHQRLTEAGDAYWATLADAQRKTIAAWAAYAKGDRESGLALMRQAADIEDGVDKHPVTPGAVLPARELLGDMLVLVGRHDDAVEAYEASLKISPNRFNSLYGAGRAAQMAGDGDTARAYYEKLTTMAGETPTDRPAFIQARTYMDRNHP